MTGNPYREQEFHEPCGRCEVVSTSTAVCRRCSVPLCRDHAPRRGRCCDQCELEFADRLSLINCDAAKPSPPGFYFIAVSLGIAAAFAFIGLLPLLPRLAMRIILFYGSPVVLVVTLWALLPIGRNPRVSRARSWLIKRQLRREFLSEGALVARLSPGDDDCQTR